MNKAPNFSTRKESGYFEGRRYDITKLYQFAEDIPVENTPIDEFDYVISPENESWAGHDDKIIGPYNIFKDWEAAQQNPAWSRHVESIKRVDFRFSYTCLLYGTRY